MIFVTVGTHNQGFERLVKKMDEIAGQIDEEVVIQVGYTDYEPKNAEWFRFKKYEEILEIIEQSNIVVCHGGAGILLDVLSKNNFIIVVPRLKEFKEVYDNHESELSEAIKPAKNMEIIYDMNKLKYIINNPHSKEINLDKKKVTLFNF